MREIRQRGRRRSCPYRVGDRVRLTHLDQTGTVVAVLEEWDRAIHADYQAVKVRHDAPHGYSVRRWTEWRLTKGAGSD